MNREEKFRTCIILEICWVISWLYFVLGAPPVVFLPISLVTGVFVFLPTKE